MPDQIKITLEKQEGGKITSYMPDSGGVDNATPEIVGDDVSTSLLLLGKYASAAVVAKSALDLATKSFMKIRTLERQNRDVQETLRNYGGEGFSTNTIGDRFDIFGRRVGGESVAYKR